MITKEIQGLVWIPWPGIDGLGLTKNWDIWLPAEFIKIFEYCNRGKGVISKQVSMHTIYEPELMKFGIFFSKNP